MPGDGRDEVFEDRALRLLVTFGGAGVLHGDLTPECAEIVGTVLDALAVPAGPEDGRDRGQRYHDALQEAMTRLIASGLLPERAGAPVRAWVNISLADLMAARRQLGAAGGVDGAAAGPVRCAPGRVGRGRRGQRRGVAGRGRRRRRSPVMRWWRRW